MTVLVIGLGSMGRRRVRLLKRYSAAIRIIGVDQNDQRCRQAQEEYGIVTYGEPAQAFCSEAVDCAFISASPLSHAGLIRTCLEHRLHVFTELNLVDTLYEENVRLAKDRGCVLFLSSTFLYRREMEYMAAEVHKQTQRVSYTYHTGQYLPDWHPWESYKNFFVGQKETNACRELMAIEFPWLAEVFGPITEVRAEAEKVSSLALDYPDRYLMLVEHENGNRGAVAVDVVSRKASRNLEVFGEEISLRWNGTPDSLYRYHWDTKSEEQIKLYDSVDKRSDYCESIIEDAYYSEIENFFGVIDGTQKPRYSFEKDKETLRLIDRIEGMGWDAKGTEGTEETNE